MTAPVKFLFDECVSDLAMKEIAKVVALSFDITEFKHIRDFYTLGILDDVWVPEKALEKCWIVVSADRSRQNKSKNSKNYKGEKLRVVCKRHELTLVELSQKIHHLPTTEKIASILFVWADLMKVADAPRGSRHLIRFEGHKPGKPIIVQIDPPLAAE